MLVNCILNGLAGVPATINAQNQDKGFVQITTKKNAQKQVRLVYILKMWNVQMMNAIVRLILLSKCALS